MEAIIKIKQLKKNQMKNPSWKGYTDGILKI